MPTDPKLAPKTEPRTEPSFEQSPEQRCEDRFDQILDAALPGYSAAEPQPGLEGRILARALAEPRRQNRFAWAWTLAIPGLACLLIFFALRFIPHRAGEAKVAASNNSRMPHLGRAAIASTAGGKKAAPSNQHGVPHPGRGFVASRVGGASAAASNRFASQALPKQEVFPSPSPLTAEEQALVASDRAQLRDTIARPGAQIETHPITIAELDIQPLDIPALDQPSSNPDPNRNDHQP